MSSLFQDLPLIDSSLDFHNCLYNIPMEMFKTLAPEAKFAVDFLGEASVLARKIQDEMVDPALEKNDRSPVTVADIAVQALLGYYLSERNPGAALIAEESSTMFAGEEGHRLVEAAAAFISSMVPGFREQSFRALLDYGAGLEKSNYWVLDPIDGTKGFLRGDQYAVALAYIEKGEVVLGGLACPRLSETGPGEASSVEKGNICIAVKGEGTYSRQEGDSDWTRTGVSRTDDPAEAVVLRSFESGHTNVSDIDRITGELGVQAAPLRVDSQVKYTLLARGKGDIYLRIPSASSPGYVEKIWDHAAGKLVVEEAGGKSSDINGNPLDFSRGRFLDQNKGVIATNGILHDKVLEAIRKI